MELKESDFLNNYNSYIENITKNDYIKIIDDENELQQAIKLMKIVFPNHWKYLRRKKLSELKPKNNEYLLGYFVKTQKLIGFVQINELQDYKVIGISSLQVRSSYRNRGVATALLACIQQIATKKEYKYLYLTVKYDNKMARALYSKLNFQPMPTIYLVENINLNVTAERINNILRSFKRFKIDDYESLVKPFLISHFNEYQRVFQQHKRAVKMIKEKRVYGWIHDDTCEFLFTESHDNTQLDIYIPETNRKKLRILSILRLQDTINIKSYSTIHIVSNLKNNELRIFERNNIKFATETLKQALYKPVT